MIFDVLWVCFFFGRNLDWGPVAQRWQRSPKVPEREPGPILCTAEDDALIVYEGGMAEEAQCTAPPGPVLVKVGGLESAVPAGSG